MTLRTFASLALVTLALSYPSLARQIPPAEAERLALELLGPRRGGEARALPQLQLTERPHYYIYNAGTASGFALIGKDSSGELLLGYSPTGHFDLDSLPPAFRALLEGYRPVASPPASGARALPFPQPYKQAVAPLVKTRWNQDFPYNMYCPKIDRWRAPSGCVATAIAQLMYFHRWPSQGRGSNTHPQLGATDFSQSTYAWEAMDLTYRGQHNSPGPIAEDPYYTSVARLMRDIGAATGMMYNLSGSGAWPTQGVKGLREFFGYEVSDVLALSALGRRSVEDFIEEELRRGYPLFISGGSPGGSAHAWVLDGMDGRGLFHMNLGWGGTSNGFYSLGALRLGSSGSEFGGHPITFSQNISVFALRPARGEEDEATLHGFLVQRLSGKLESYLRLVSSSSASLVVELGEFVNRGYRPFRGDYGYGLYDEAGKLLRVYPSKYHPQGGFTQTLSAGELIPDGLINRPEQDQLPLSGLTDGSYRLLPMSARRLEDGRWQGWHPWHLAPSLRFALRQGQVSVLEEDGLEQGIQLLAPLQHGRLQAGKEALVSVLIKNLSALDRDLRLRLRLLGSAGEELTASPQQGEALAPLESRLITFRLTLPSELATGSYPLSLEATNQAGKTFPVQLLDRKQGLQLSISPTSEAETEALGATWLLAGREQPSYPLIDLRSGGEVKLRIRLRTAQPQPSTPSAFTVSLYDTQTEERLPWGSLAPASPASTSGGASGEAYFDTPALPTTLREKLIEGYVYRLLVEESHQGQPFDLWTSREAPHYLSFIGANPAPKQGQPEIVQALAPTAPLPKPEEKPEPTPVDEALSLIPTLQYYADEGRLRISAEGLRTIEVFALTGTLLKRSSAPSGYEAELSLADLPRGIYLVRVVWGGGAKTFRIGR